METRKSYVDYTATPVLTEEEEKSLIAFYKKTGNKGARNRLVTSNIKFIQSIANKYRENNVDIDDLMAEGVSGILYAIDVYDTSRGIRFLSYAVWWIRSYITRYVYANCHSVKFFSFSSIEKHKKLHSLEKLQSPVPLSEMSDFRTIDSLINHDDEEIEFGVGNSMDRKSLLKAISQLSSQEKKVVSLYYGFTGGENFTLADVAPYLNVTRERIRQIKAKALDKLFNSINLQKIDEKYSAVA